MLLSEMFGVVEGWLCSLLPFPFPYCSYGLSIINIFSPPYAFPVVRFHLCTPTGNHVYGCAGIWWHCKLGGLHHIVLDSALRPYKLGKCMGK